MKIETTFVTGNFALAVSGEFNEENLAKVLKNGLQYILQRDVATKTYDLLAGVKTKTGKLKVEEKFKRASLAFDEAAAAEFHDVAEEELKKFGEFSVIVTKNEGSDGAAAMSMATEFVRKAREKDVEKQRVMFAAFDATPEMADSAIVLLVHAGLGDLRKPKEKKSA